MKDSHLNRFWFKNSIWIWLDIHTLCGHNKWVVNYQTQNQILKKSVEQYCVIKTTEFWAKNWSKYLVFINTST